MERTAVVEYLGRPEVTRTLDITGRDIAGPVLLRPVKPFGVGDGCLNQVQTKVVMYQGLGPNLVYPCSLTPHSSFPVSSLLSTTVAAK